MSARQTGDMTSKPPISPVSEAHTRHDHLIIAALASGDVIGREREDAQLLVSTCDACRLLHDDLRLITGAVRALPPATAALNRDFRLTADDASRLTHGGWLRRLVRPFGEARRSVIRPVAGAMMAFGLAVVVLSAPSLMLFGGAAGGPAGALPEAAYGPSQTTAIQDQASPFATGAGVGRTDGIVGAPTDAGPPTSTSAPAIIGAPIDTGAPTHTGAARPTGDGGAKTSSTDSSGLEAIGERIPWPIIGVTLVSTGLALLVLRGVALRLR